MEALGDDLRLGQLSGCVHDDGLRDRRGRCVRGRDHLPPLRGELLLGGARGPGCAVAVQDGERDRPPVDLGAVLRRRPACSAGCRRRRSAVGCCVVVGVALVLLPPVPEITQNSAPSATTSPSTARIRAVGNPGRFGDDPLRLEAAGEPVVEALVAAGRIEATPAGASRPARGLQLAHGSAEPYTAHTIPPWRSRWWIRGWTPPASRRSRRRSSGPRASARRGPQARREPDSLFALASLTKPIVALAVLVAVEEGALDLDAPVGRHLAAYAAGPRAAVTPRHLLAHASGLPESGPAGVPALEVELARPPGDAPRLLQRGLRRAGRADRRGDRASRTPDYVRQAVFEPLGMDAFLGLPEHEDARALEVREPGMWRPGPPALQLASSGAGGRPPRAGRSRRPRRTRASSRCSCARGAPLHRARDLRRHGARAVPGPRRRDRVVPDRGTSPTGGSAATSATGRSRTGSRPPARRPPCRTSAPSGTLMWADPVARVGLVCLANRGTYSGWMMQPGGWPDLSDAVVARGGVRDWRVCPRCAAGLRLGPVQGEDADRLHCPACGLVLYENPAPTVSAIVERDGRVLLTRRGDRAAPRDVGHARRLHRGGRGAGRTRCGASSSRRPASRSRSATSSASTPTATATARRR